jgi:hypothetical protein
VADKVFDANTENFLRNLYRTRQWQHPPRDLGPGMAMINLATAAEGPGDLMMSEAELADIRRGLPSIPDSPAASTGTATSPATGKSWAGYPSAWSSRH